MAFRTKIVFITLASNALLALSTCSFEGEYDCSVGAISTSLFQRDFHVSKSAGAVHVSGPRKGDWLSQVNQTESVQQISKRRETERGEIKKRPALGTVKRLTVGFWLTWFFDLHEFDGTYCPANLEKSLIAFIPVFLCMIAVLFQVSSKDPVADESLKVGLPKSMPALASLRYIAILCFWVSHKWLALFPTSHCFTVLSGFVLQFAEERRGKPIDSLADYAGFLRRRLSKLYPLYALAVVVAHATGTGVNGKCKPIASLTVIPLWLPWYHRTYGGCFAGAWFIPCIIQCYLWFPILSRSLQKVSFGSTCILASVCWALQFLFWQMYGHGGSELDRTDDVIILFFLGMVLARAWVFMSTSEHYGSFCKVACHLSLVALLVGRIVSGVFVLQGSWHLSSPRPTFLNAWMLFWQCIMILGFAGPRRGEAQSPRSNFALSVLSWEPLSWMGELALPLYITMSIVCTLTDNVMLKAAAIFGDTFVTTHQAPWDDPAKYIREPKFARLFLVEFVAMHGVALLIWKAMISNRAERPEASKACPEHNTSETCAEKTLQS